MDRFPNLLIVGAPKCGTTSLFGALSQHLDIFAPRLKEPNYFGSDVPFGRRPSKQEFVARHARSASLRCGTTSATRH